jgi:protein-disulfide isomerase
MDTQKLIIIWASAVLVVAIAAIGAYQVATGPKAKIPLRDGTMSTPLDQTDNTKGAKNPKVTFVEYSDFQCPACGLYYSMIEEMYTEYQDRISFIYRHFPLPQHENAISAAYASEAAGKQGKFWEMSDLLFKNQSEWSKSLTAQIIFEKYAQKIGLDIVQYKKDFRSDEVKAKNATESVENSSVNHTPTFFINGKLSTINQKMS